MVSEQNRKFPEKIWILEKTAWKVEKIINPMKNDNWLNINKLLGT